MAEPIVFILGAGASASFGLPTGDKLKSLICDDPMPENMVVGLDPYQTIKYKEHYKSFVEAFKNSGQSSIDRFLHYRPQFADIGKIAISYYINHAESKAQGKLASGWIAWLFDRMYYQHTNLSDWPVSFVTFNYDRILESSLAVMLANTRGRSFSESYKDVVRSLNIYHVYGHLQGWPAEHLENQGMCDFESVPWSYSELSKGIYVIGEDRSISGGKADLVKAKQWIESAATRVFLGFGFDQDNCEIIGLGKENRIRDKSGRWIATAKGLLDAERNHCCEMSPGRLVLGGMKHDCLYVVRDKLRV